MALTIAELHDFKLTGIALDDAKAVLSLEGPDGVICTLELGGLQTLQMDDFKQGNIISHVEIIAGAEPRDSSPLDHLFPGPHPEAAAEYHAQHADYLAAQAARVAAGEAILVVITPSYGAYLVALCERLDLRESG